MTKDLQRLIIRVIVACAVCFPVGSCLAQSINFTHLLAKDEIPIGGVSAVRQDLRGFIWFATEDGLRKYDGYKLESYRRELSMGQLVRLRENTVNVLSIDQNNRIWYGTDDGLYYLNSDSTKSHHINPTEEDVEKGAAIIRALAVEPSGLVWLGGPGGLYKLDRGAQVPIKIADHISVTALYWDVDSRQLYIGTRPGDVLRLAEEDGELQPVFSCGVGLRAIHGDHDGGLWIATEGTGAVRVKDGKAQVRLTNRADDPSSLPSNVVTCIFQDSERDLWFGTLNGLSRYDLQTRDLTTYQHDAEDPRTLPTNEIRSLFEDKDGVVWVGHSRGVSRFALAQRTFAHIRHRASDPNSLSHDAVFGMLADSKGRLWVGTEGGLNLRDANGGFRHFKFTSAEASIAGANFIYVINEAPDGKLWLGTRGSGLILFDPETEAHEFLQHSPGSADSIPHNSITALATDETGRQWVGTYGGIAVLDNSGAVITRYQHDPDDPASLASDSVSDILASRFGLFVATEDAGVMSFDGTAETFTPLSGLSTGKISSLSEDRDGQLWIGTHGSGVHAYNPKWERLLHINHDNSNLPDNRISGILQDRAGYFWISTSNGLARCEAEAEGEKVRVFDTDDGIQSMVFHPKAYCLDSAGYLYFGGAAGFNKIDPDNVPEPRVAHQTILTGLEVNGERVEPGENNPYLKEPIATTKELKLSFDRTRRLAFTFATLDYTYPVSNRFRYRMLPIETDWTDAGKERKAAYSTLPAGDYTFEVQASVDGQRWNRNSARIDIHILRPWFKSWSTQSLFVLTGIAVVGLSIALFYRRQSLRDRRGAEALENERNKAEAALAGQLQRAMLVQRTSYELHQRDSDSLFSLILDRLNSHFESNCCILSEYCDEPTPSLKLLVDRYEGMDDSFTFSEISPDNPVVQKVLSRRHAVVSENIAADDLLSSEAPALLEAGITSLLAIKTSYQGVPNGILFLLHREERSWADEDVRLMETVADHIGVNIAHHRLALADEQQRAELEAALTAAETANRAQSDFLAKMTHELRTPLNSILGFCETLTQDVTINQDQRSTLDIIYSSGEHLLETITDVLDMSKIESGLIELTKEEFDLRELLGSVTGMFMKRAEARNLDLELECANDVPSWVLADKVKLRKVLVNLVSNAIKFTDSGGITIRVRAHSEAADPSAAAGKRIPRHLQFEVVDTGSGISESQMQDLFKTFFQTDSGRASGGGAGLGLAITKTFVELMGGEISVRSDVGVGTIFAFDIHCVELSAEAAEKKIARVKAAAGAKLASGQDEVRVLIAEDQLPNRLLLRTVLERRGFKVFEAENGKEAIEAWKTCDPHIIFMDNEMPVMDGMQATREIISQADGERPPCIVSCTAYALDSFRDEAMEAGCADFLAKPYQQEQLFDLIGRHLPVEYDMLSS